MPAVPVMVIDIRFWKKFSYVVFIGDTHITFHNFFILYPMHALDSGGILGFCLCIPTVLTM
jgi:hypothetical protein